MVRVTGEFGKGQVSVRGLNWDLFDLGISLISFAAVAGRLRRAHRLRVGLSEL